MKRITTTLLVLAAGSLPVLALANQSRGGAPQSPPAQKPPAQKPSPDLEAQRKAEQEKKQTELARSYFSIADYDSNGWVSYREARSSLEIDRSRFHVYDANLDGQITVDEYIFVSLETFRRLGAFKAPIPNPDDPTAASRLEAIGLTLEGEEVPDETGGYQPAQAESILELFGRVKSRVRRENSAPEPDQIVGPVPSFRRLDFDNNGAIGRNDLDLLLLGAGLDMRPNALIASLDTDGDGSISEAEFAESMGGAPR